MALEKFDSRGDGLIYWPSGRFSVVVCKAQEGQLITFYADNERSTVRFEQRAAPSVGHLQVKSNAPPTSTGSEA